MRTLNLVRDLAQFEALDISQSMNQVFGSSLNGVYGVLLCNSAIYSFCLDETQLHAQIFQHLVSDFFIVFLKFFRWNTLKF